MSLLLNSPCHHALTCRSGGDIIARHNKLRDSFANLCSKACLSPQLEKGPGLDFSRPADVLVSNWSLSNPAAFDLKVIHPLNTDLIAWLQATLQRLVRLENLPRMIRCVQGWAGHAFHWWWMSMVTGDVKPKNVSLD